MKKTMRVLWIVLALCVMLPPATVLATTLDLADGSIVITDAGNYTQGKTAGVNEDGVYTITGSGEAGVTVAENAGEVSIPLEGASITAAKGKAAIDVKTGAKVTLTLSGENTLTGGEKAPAVSVPKGANVTITSATGDNGKWLGSLTVTGGAEAAGIGSAPGRRHRQHHRFRRQCACHWRPERRGHRRRQRKHRGRHHH